MPTIIKKELTKKELSLLENAPLMLNHLKTCCSLLKDCHLGNIDEVKNIIKLINKIDDYD